MPEPPDRRIEELLQAYAAKRREEMGAPLELHPAARRILQAEVARVHRRQAAPPTTWWNSLAVFWPRLAFAAAVCAVLGICAWWLVPRGDEALEMARNEPPARPLAATRGLEEKNHSIRSGELSRATAVVENLDVYSESRALNAPASPPPQPTPTRLLADAPRRTRDLAKAADKAKPLEQLAAARPAVPTTAPADGLGVHDPDSSSFKYPKRGDFAGGTSRTDLAAQMARSASVRPTSGPARQVTDAPAVDVVGQPGLDNVRLPRALAEPSRSRFVATPTGGIAAGSPLSLGRAAFAEAAGPVANGKPSAASFGGAGGAPPQKSAEKAGSAAPEVSRESRICRAGFDRFLRRGIGRTTTESGWSTRFQYGAIGRGPNQRLGPTRQVSRPEPCLRHHPNTDEQDAGEFGSGWPAPSTPRRQLLAPCSADPLASEPGAIRSGFGPHLPGNHPVPEGNDRLRNEARLRARRSSLRPNLGCCDGESRTDGGDVRFGRVQSGGADGIGE